MHVLKCNNKQAPASTAQQNAAKGTPHAQRKAVIIAKQNTQFLVNRQAQEAQNFSLGKHCEYMLRFITLSTPASSTAETLTGEERYVVKKITGYGQSEDGSLLLKVK